MPLLVLTGAAMGGLPWTPAAVLAAAFLIAWLMLETVLRGHAGGHLYLCLCVATALCFYAIYARDRNYPALLTGVVPAFELGKKLTGVRQWLAVIAVVVALLAYRLASVSPLPAVLHPVWLLLMVLLLAMAFLLGSAWKRLIAGGGDEFSCATDATGLLSAREAEILQLLVGGLSYREVAGQLFISPGTARAHGAALLRKSGTHDRAALVAWAKSQGFARTETGAGRVG